MSRSILDRRDPKELVATTTTPLEAKEMETLAAAAKRYAESLEDRNYAAEVQLRAGRHGGALLIEMARDGKRRTQATAKSTNKTLLDLGIEPMRSSRWQWLARLSEERFEAYLAEQKAAAEPITFAHVGQSSGENEWYTPPEYIEAATAVMGGIDLDPASTAVANEVVGAETFYTLEDNGLALPWRGRVWMNPPYAQPAIWDFCEKLSEEVAQGNVEQAIALVNNATETSWFGRMAEVAGAICFPAGRVKFWHPDRESAPLQGQAVIYFGEDGEKFRAEFVRFGFTVSL